MATMRRNRSRIIIGTVLATLLLLTACLPDYTGVQFRDLQNLITYPRTTPTTRAPTIRGHAGADARIQQLAEARGYRLRPVHTGARRTVAGVPLDVEAAGALDELMAAARRAGHTLHVTSGYRGVDHQTRLFLNGLGSVSNAAIASGQADGTVIQVLRTQAPPGYSKHHTGYAVDFISPQGGLRGFASSPAGRWLAADNHLAAKLRGFVPSYPSGAGAQGPEPEPWEYIYVGVDNIECGLSLARDRDRSAFEACLREKA